MRIEEEVKLDYKDVLLRPKRSTLNSRADVDISRKFAFRNNNNTFEGIPVIASNMDGVGTMSMARSFSKHDMMVAFHKHYEIDELLQFYKKEKLADKVFYTMGIKDADLSKLSNFAKKGGKNFLKNICIDVANGYTERFADFIKSIREKFPNSIIMAGNVVTGEMTEQLILSGADIVKVGIGSGSACTTRKMTGVGYPQLSAVIECADAAHGVGGHICADGGCQVPGDIVKAFGAGADFVMLGGMLAGHEESESEIIEKDGKKYLRFYGSSSEESMMKHNNGVAKYRTSEGRSVDVPLKGPVEITIQEILGGLRSACTYVGARKLKELPKRTTFVRVTEQLNPMFDRN
ncbi:MAG: GMP reductase [Candidatus Paceibacterota bacterium]